MSGQNPLYGFVIPLRLALLHPGFSPPATSGLQAIENIERSFFALRHSKKYSTLLSSTHRSSLIPRGTAHSARRFSEGPSCTGLFLLRCPATTIFSGSFITTAGKTGKSPAKKRPTRTWLSSYFSTENQFHWAYSKSHRYTADRTSTAISALPLQSHIEASDSSR